MENLAHTLAGAVICRACGLEKKTAAAMPAILIAANLPDADVFGVLFKESYLDVHRGITHAAAGIIVLSGCLAALIWGISRLVQRDRARRLTFAPIWYVCFLGLLSHPLLDFLNDYGLRPWLPFSSRRYYGDLVGIVDPWMWVIFGSALYLTARARWAKNFWFALGLFLLAIVVLAAGWRMGLCWVAGLGAAVWLIKSIDRSRLHPARVALGIFAVYLGCVAISRNIVLSTARTEGPELVAGKVQRIDVLPRLLGNLQTWEVVIDTADKYYLADVDLHSWRSHPPKFETFPKNLDDPSYEKSLSQSQMAILARFARFPSVEVEQYGGSCTVFLKDLRYARRNLPGWGTAHATVACQ